MKIFDKIFKLCAAALLVLPFTGCGEEEMEKPSALLSESSLTFDAVGAEPQTLMVASDDAWFIDVDSDWITVDPQKGVNTVDVTVAVADNVSGGAMNAPREGVITIANNRGYSIRTVIYQKGDTYLGVGEYDLAGISGLDDGTRAKVKETQVVAVASDGFIASDASALMYILGNAENVKAGDWITMNGAASTTNSIKTFTSDEVTVVSNSEVVYPEARDVTGTLSEYKPEAIEYVKVSGTLINKGLRVGSVTNAVTLYNPGIDIETVNLHKVVAYGYSLVYSKTLYFVPTSFEDGGLDEDLSFYPVKYQIRKTPVNFTTASFSAEGKIEPIEGLGYIEYVPFDLANTNDNNKYALDVSDSSPRVTGSWPGDYWLFYCYGAVKAGSVMHITFEARTSATGHKYWMLEYLDGETWKAAADKQKASDASCEYTHAMNADGSTNVQVDAEVKIKKNMDNCQFRFRCMANWQANGSGALATRNGGSARLSVTDKESDEFQPKIYMVKEGDGVEIPDTDPVEANIVVSKDLLTFEGTPDGPVKLTVTSDYDFTIESSADWLALDVKEGLANEQVEVTVTCSQSTLSTLREAQITIKSEETRKVINVVQSAAGQDLDPFVSVTTGNAVSTGADETVLRMKVQANVEFESESDVEWLSIVPQTKSLVEWTDVAVQVAANTDAAARTGHIRFFNTEKNLETSVTVTQEGYVAPPSDVIFSDDFSWMAQYVSYYNANSGKKIGRSVEENNASGNAPNFYTDATIIASGWQQALLSRGYEDINADKKSIYPQDCYWKFGKTSSHTGFRLPAIDYTGDATLTFDWSPHMTGSGSIDKVNVVVEIEGSGKVVTEAGLASVSDPFVNDWETGKLGWKTVSATIKGLTPSDRIVIRPQYLEDHDGIKQMRWYIDNIELKKPETPMRAEWGFSADLMSQYASGFGGSEGKEDLAAGDGGMSVKSNVAGNGYIKYVQVDKSSYTYTTSKPTRIIGGTGQPYVTGAWPGDYWLFEASDRKEYPAGTKLHISFLTRCSGTGQMYWMLEAWDGAEWVSAADMKTATVEGQGEIQYNFVEAKSDVKVEHTWTLSKACKTMMFRLRCVANYTLGKKVLTDPNGGTCRISGAAATETADSTSPVFEVVAE